MDNVDVTRTFRWDDPGGYRTTVLFAQKGAEGDEAEREKRAVAKPTSATVKRRALMI